MVLQVAFEVRSPRITSTSFMTGTGFMKCIPMNRSGRLVAAAHAFLWWLGSNRRLRAYLRRLRKAIQRREKQ